MHKNILCKAKVLSYLAATLLVTLTLHVSAEVTIIGNKALSIESITAADVKKLWMTHKKPSGSKEKIRIVDAAATRATYAEFHKTLIGKSPKEIKVYWKKMMFAGRRFPPKSLDSDAEIIDWVSSNDGAIAYVDPSSVDESVKVLLTSAGE